ncbi:MAG: molybdopterin-dependent oxidoreductase [Nostocoides sp.]
MTHPTAPDPTARTWPHGVAAVVATLAGIGVGQLVAAVLAPASAPVLAIGSAVIDATPTSVKEWAVATFGTADKPVLVGSVIIVTLILAWAIGVLARHRRIPALILLVVLVSLAGWAALSRPDAGPSAVIPALATGITGLLSAAFLFARADRWTASIATPVSAGVQRRSFIVGTVGVGALAVSSDGVAQVLLRPKQATPQITLPVPATTLTPLPAGLEAKVGGISPFVTPAKDFYRIDTALATPSVDIASWQLTIDGAVNHPLTITWTELLAMPMIEADITLCCVSNEIGGDLVGSARWTGVRTADLLARVGIHPEVDQILSTSVDGMTISTPVQALTGDRDALIAVAMNGRPLPPAHGFPARLITPGLYGFTGATKWLTRMTATTYADASAYWTVRGWATDAPVITQSRIDTPRAGAHISAGQNIIGGVAWAQHRGISQVQVRIDEGPWQQATLGPDAGIDYWRQWYLPWEATPGEHTLTVRAKDHTGAWQDERVTDVLPRGATGLHAVRVR